MDDTQAITETVERLERLAVELGISAEDLDDAVIDCKLDEASNTNNEGRTGQLGYLLTALGAEKLEQEIRDMAKRTASVLEQGCF